MNDELITTDNALAVQNNAQVTLLDMRKDPKRFPRIGTYPREQAVFEMSKIVSQVFLYKGQTVDPINIQFISCSLVDELQADLDKMGTKNISFEEISRIVKRAVLTDDIFLSVSSFYKVIMTYIKGEGHRLHKQVIAMQEREEQEQMRQSIIAPMLQAYAGAMIKHSKV